MKYHFSAQLPTGGSYKFKLNAINIEGELPHHRLLALTAPAGSLGNLQKQIKALLASGVDPATPVYVASDAEGNSYNTVAEIEESKGTAFIFVNHDNIFPEDLENVWG